MKTVLTARNVAKTWFVKPAIVAWALVGAQLAVDGQNSVTSTLTVDELVMVQKARLAKAGKLYTASELRQLGKSVLTHAIQKGKDKPDSQITFESEEIGNHRIGVMLQDGNAYDGTYLLSNGHAVQDGLGTQCWSDGPVFYGNYRKGNRSGYGSLLYPDGSVYNGFFDADNRQGLGCITYSNGSTLIGEFSNDKPTLNHFFIHDDVIDKPKSVDPGGKFKY